MHSIQNSSVNWFQTVLNRRQSSLNNNRHSVVNIRLLHFLDDFDPGNAFLISNLVFLPLRFLFLSQFFFYFVLVNYFWVHFSIFNLYIPHTRLSLFFTSAIWLKPNELQKFNEAIFFIGSCKIPT